MKKNYKILILLAIFWSSFAFAQTGKILIVNSDSSVYRYEEIATEFKKNLQLNGYQWTEITVEKNANAEEELKQLIQENQHSLIFCLGSEAFSLADKLAHNKKMLFSGIINWQRFTIGEKTNGVANELSITHELSLVHYFFPLIKNIGVLYSGTFSQEYVENLKKVALPLGINIISQSSDAGQNALNELMPKIELFWLISDPNVLIGMENVKHIFATAKQHNKPVYAYSDVFINQGAVMSISLELTTIGRQAASLAIKMDQDEKSGRLVQAPAGSTITLNKCVLDALKLKFNPDGMDSVNHVVGCGK